MENGTCKYIKLINGDNIVARTDDDCANIKSKSKISISDPVEIRTIRFPRGRVIVEQYTMQPWIKISCDKIIDLPTESILCVVNLYDEAIEQYDDFIKNYDDIEEEANTSSHGFVETIFENETDLNNDYEQSDPDEDEGPTSKTTFH